MLLLEFQVCKILNNKASVTILLNCRFLVKLREHSFRYIARLDAICEKGMKRHKRPIAIDFDSLQNNETAVL